jgi:protein subunit release factor B
MPRYTTAKEQLEREVRLETYRAGGPGGQHRNKTDTAVRIHHPPSGVTVTATERRSQLQNRALAFARLIERLEQLNKVVKPRKPTRRTKGSMVRRLDAKRQRGATKAGRQKPQSED